jgi:branched-subunit amino acid aminotransferase/4-amino-4-deoxychorismate lyase
MHIHAYGKLESHMDALKRLAFILNLPQDDTSSRTDEAFEHVYQQQEERIAYVAKSNRKSASE